MLVFAKNPKGILCLGNEKFYGQDFGLPPHDISYSFFKQFKDSFAEATYREKDLERIFGKPCDLVIAFKYSELKFLPDATLDKIAKWIGCRPYQKRFSNRRKVRIIQSALRWESAKPPYKNGIKNTSRT
jgi:hypothetical protein